MESMNFFDFPNKSENIKFQGKASCMKLDVQFTNWREVSLGKRKWADPKTLNRREGADEHMLMVRLNAAH